VQQLRGTRKGGTFVGAQCRLCFWSCGKGKGNLCSEEWGV